MKTPLRTTPEGTTMADIPPMGVKCRIKSIERTRTAPDAEFSPPNALQYAVVLEVVEPKRYAGTELRWWCVVGSEEDPRAREPHTWEQSRDWPHMKRLLVRSGTPIPDDGDDEEWMEAAVGRTICVHTRRNAAGYPAIAMRSSFMRETDEDFVGVGQLLEDRPPRNGRAGRRRDDEPERPAAKRVLAPSPAVDDEEEPDEAPVQRPSALHDEEDDEEEPQPAPPRRRVAARRR